MKRMSFTMTVSQMRNRSNTETRRLGWKDLGAGDRVLAIEKGMGLKKGEKHVVIGEIEIIAGVNVRLNTITQEQVNAEGFPHMTPKEFVKFFCKQAGCKPTKVVRRIIFRHVPENERTPL